MSYNVFFMFSEGLSKTIKVPKGTKESIAKHVEWVEDVLKIERETYLDNPEHWAYNDYKHLTDKEFCEVAEKHNWWVQRLYENMAIWSENPPKDYESITPKYAKTFWPALNTIRVDVNRWSSEYYRTRMESFYEVMRGRESEGISFDAKPLTEKQAAAVIILFSEYLDKDDIRLDVPKGHDQLLASYDGGYEWCEKCGSITYEDSLQCNSRKCPLKKYYEEN